MALSTAIYPALNKKFFCELLSTNTRDHVASVYLL